MLTDGDFKNILIFQLSLLRRYHHDFNMYICISSNSKKSFLFFSIDKAVIYIYIQTKLYQYLRCNNKHIYYLIYINIYTCSQKISVFKPLRSRILLDFFAMSSSSLTRLAVSAVAGVAVGFGLGAWYALRLGRRKVGEETNKQSSVLFPDLCLCVLFCYFAIRVCFVFLFYQTCEQIITIGL